MTHPISGFSKLSKSEKIRLGIRRITFKKMRPNTVNTILESLMPSLQNLHDEFIENTITNFYLPLGVAPNFLINNKLYTIPMAIEESSVVAAASKSAKFWLIVVALRLK